MLKILSFIVKTLFTFEVIFLFKNATHEMKQQTSKADIVPANEENIKDVLNFQDSKYIDIFREFIKSGDIGYLGYLDGKCIHRSWVVCTPQIVNLHRFLKMRLLSDEAFIHYCETAEYARGKNIYPHVLTEIVDNFLSFKEKKTIYISADSKNLPSIKGIEKAGFEKIAKIGILVILGIKIIIILDKKGNLPEFI